MSRLEDEIRPIIAPMMRGETTMLGVGQQTMIIRWLLKTAMMHEHLDKQPTYFTPEDCRAFMENFTIPQDTLCFLAYYGGPRNIITRETQLPLQVRRPGSDRAVPFNAYTATFAFQCLILQIFTYRRPQEFSRDTIRITVPTINRVNWDALSIQIWPNDEIVYWPPLMAFGTPGFELFADRWLTVTRE